MDVNWDQEFDDVKASDEELWEREKQNVENTVADDEEAQHIRKPSNAELVDRASTLKKKEDAVSDAESEEWDVDRELNSLKKDFYDKEKHFFIVTWGGRPLYSRYGKLNGKHMISFMGVVSLMPANVENVERFDSHTRHDNIRAFVTADVSYVYLICGPLYLFCISKTGETVSQIRNQLKYMYQEIVGTLTNSFEKTLLQSPQFDLRTIFGKTDYMLLEGLVNECDKLPIYLFDAYCPVELTKNIRDEIGNVVKQCKKTFKDSLAKEASSSNPNWIKKLLFSLLLINGQVVSITQSKKRPLDAQDIILLSHIVKHSQSFRQSETFVPICLPHFEPSGFVYAYVAYFEETNICLLLITVDGTAFKKCQYLRKMIEKEMKSLNLLHSLNTAFTMHPFECSTLFDVLKIHKPQIFAFYYHNIKKNQFICPLPIKLFNTPAGRVKLFRRLQHLHNRVHSTPHHSIYFERCKDDAAICKLVSNEYEIFILMNCFATKQDASDVMEKIIAWVASRSMNLFMSPVVW